MHIFHGGNGRAVSVRVTSQPSSNHHRWSSFGGFRVSARLKSNSNFKGNTRRLSTGNRGLFLLLGKKAMFFHSAPLSCAILTKANGECQCLYGKTQPFLLERFFVGRFFGKTALFFSKRDLFSKKEPAIFLKATWLILPVVICLSKRLSHACLSISWIIQVKLRMAH